MKNYLSLLIIGLLFLGANTTIIFAQTITKDASKAEKIKAEILKRGTSDKKRVKVKMLDGKRFKGYISETGVDSFTLKDSKTKQPTTIAYRDVEEVSSDWSKGSKIGLIVGIGAAATLTILYIAFQNAIRNN